VICPPEPDPIWDYRRRAIGDALRAAKQMLLRHADTSLVSPAGSLRQRSSNGTYRGSAVGAALH
jgi:hypothetical protein